MVDFTQFFLTLGILFLAGLLTDLLGRRSFLPRVSLLMLLGFIIGPSVLDIVPEIGHRWFPAVADMALVMVGFLLGGQLTIPFFKKSGKDVIWISLFDLTGTATIMTMGMLLLGQPLIISLLLGAIATATAPAATIDVVRETNSKGPFTDILLGIVGIDDVWGVMYFTLILSFVMAMAGTGGGLEVLATGLWDVGGAILLGVIIGAPMAYLSGRINPGEPTLLEALGFVFLCAGVAFWLEVSFLLSSMVMGIVVVNLAKHHSRPFNAIEGIEWPFLILFFILSGASLHVEAIASAGYLVLCYVVLRILGRFLGASTGALLSGADTKVRKYIWLGLKPQAGIALGLALYACQRFQELSEVIMPVIISGTIIFEFFGPVMTKIALKTSGETNIT
jgi:Kef-type K+ transport system membrane component KefB